MLVLDLVEVARVIVGDVNGVMRQIELALDAEIHHEGRAGEFLAGNLAIGPTTAKVIGHEALHGAGEVGIDHDRIGRFHSRWPCARRPRVALRRALLRLAVETDLNAQSLGHARHRRGDRGATADRMEHAIFVFEERENREQARAAERRHAEIF